MMPTLSPYIGQIGELYFFTLVGACLCYGKLSLEKRRLYGFAPVIEVLIRNERAREVLGLLICLALGTVIGMSTVAPSTTLQAIAAGAAWTAVATGTAVAK